MNTILYIGDTYISTLAQLRQCVLDAFGNERKSTLMREIETLYRDGVLQDWLGQGDAEEQWLADELKSIKKDIDSSKLCEHIALILTDELYSVSRNINDYIEVEKCEVYADGKSILDDDIKDLLGIKSNRVFFTQMLFSELKVWLQCKVKKDAAEAFRLCLKCGNFNVADDFLLNLREYSLGQIVNVEFNVSEATKTPNVDLLMQMVWRENVKLSVVADENLMYSFVITNLKNHFVGMAMSQLKV